MGQVLAAGSGQNPARQAVIKSGLNQATPGLTINAVCGSGLKAVMLAAQAVAWGDSEIVIAGGQENMSAAPHVLMGSRDGQRMGDWKLTDSMIVDGLWDVYNQYHMGITAENVAKKYGISREAQDALALASQQKAAAAQDAGKFKDEIVPFSIAQKKGDPVIFAADEFVNRKTNAEALAGLRPAFDKAGGVTAGNASGINDGAAAVMVMTAKKAAALGLKPLGRIASFATSGIHYGLFCATPSVPLVRNVPAKRAMEMLLTGDFIDAPTALAQGLVNRVVPADALDAEVEQLVQSILQKPRVAVAMGKALVYQQRELGIDAAYQLAGQTMATNMMDGAAQEGARAFAEKRQPAWKR